MARVAVIALALAGGWGCPDYCPPGEVDAPATVRCRVVRADGGPAEGVAARCSHSDGGAVTDSTGTFSFVALERTCGIAAGSMDCGMVEFSENGGPVLVSFAGEGASDAGVSASRLTNANCQLVTTH